MKFSVIMNGGASSADRAAREIIQAFISHGHQLSADPQDLSFVLNVTDAAHPRAGRRLSESMFVVSLIEANGSVADMRAFCYTALIRTLSNLLICVGPPLSQENHGSCEVYFTTPEAGFYHFPFTPEAAYQAMLPIASSRYAIHNTVSTDLPERLWCTSPVVEQLKRFGAELDEWGVLPTPFPLRDLLGEEDMRHLYKIYGITGLSYGNLSARESVPELGPSTFWMTGRGVDKARIERVGKDVLLVKGFDEARRSALISMPPSYEPRARVSVDAVEHALIYKTFPEVGAIVHVHAWMQDILHTQQNYPCGTLELAEEVVSLLQQTHSPGSAVVGLKNHGLTITGSTLEDIFDRIRGKLQCEVPMFT